MGLLERLGLKRVRPNELHRISVPKVVDGQELHSPTDPRTIVNLDRGWVYACTRINGRAAASIPLRLFTKNPGSGKFKTKGAMEPGLWEDLRGRSSLAYTLKGLDQAEEIEDHPLLDLLNNINPEMDSVEFFEGVSVNLDLTGDAFVVKVAGGLPTIQPVSELWILPTHTISVIPSSKTLVGGYIYRRGTSSEKVFKPEEVIHFREFDPVNQFFGKSALSAAMAPASLSKSAYTYEDALLKNNSVPDVLISVEGNPDADAEKRLEAKWRRRHGGVAKSGRIGIIGNIRDVIKLGMNPKEMSFKDGQQTWKDEICGVMGVPTAFVSRDTNLANIQGSMQIHARFTIRPRLLKIEQRLNQQLVPDFGDDIFLAFDNPVPEDVMAKREDMKARRRSGVSTANEERLRIGEKPSNEPEADMLHIEGTMRPISEQRRQEAKEQAASIQQASQAAAKPDEEPKKAGVKSLQVNVPGANASWALRLAILSVLADAEFEVKTALEGIFVSKADEEPDDRTVARKLAILLAALAPWERILIRRSAAPLTALAEIGGFTGIAQMATGQRFNASAPSVLKALEEFTRGFSSRVIDVGGELLTVTMTEGFKAGEPAQVVANRVSQAFQVIRDERVTRIVRTETQRALNVGLVEGWKQTGIVQGKEWLASGDACPFCLAAQDTFNSSKGGKPATLDAPFYRKGDTIEAKFPKTTPADGRFADLPAEDFTEPRVLKLDYSDTQAPPLHPHCRCTVMPVIKEFGA